MRVASLKAGTSTVTRGQRVTAGNVLRAARVAPIQAKAMKTAERTSETTVKTRNEVAKIAKANERIPLERSASAPICEKAKSCVTPSATQAARARPMWRAATESGPRGRTGKFPVNSGLCQWTEQDAGLFHRGPRAVGRGERGIDQARPQVIDGAVEPLGA